jgi:hypothetical protein
VKDNDIEALHQVVAGLKPLCELDLSGLGISFSECREGTSLRREWTFGDCQRITIDVTPSIIARGLLRVIERGWDVESWAAFILAAPFITVVNAEDNDDLIQLLWNVSAGDSLTAGDLTLLDQNASGRRVDN